MEIIFNAFLIMHSSILLLVTHEQLEDRHQWWGREFRCSLLLNMDKLFPKAIIYVLYH